jgi:hypothetical protein
LKSVSITRPKIPFYFFLEYQAMHGYIERVVPTDKINIES